MQNRWDVFISYSHLDNLSASRRDGWVTKFHKALVAKLSGRLGRPALIWHDSTLTGNQVFDERIRVAIENSAILLVLYSAAYESSDYCAKERAWFARNGFHVGDQSCIFNVRLVNISHEKWPAELNGCSGFNFFSVTPADPIGRPLEADGRAFDKKLHEVVAGIDAALRTIAPVRDVTPAPDPPVPIQFPRRRDAADPGIIVPLPDGPFDLLKASLQIDFQNYLKQLKLLSARKDLHDQLHELQFKFLVPISENLSEASPEIDVTIDIVREHYFTLCEIIGSLRTIELHNKSSLPAIELNWIDAIARACDGLDVAMRDLDFAGLRAAVTSIERVLAVWPSRINAKLTENARELSLAAFSAKLKLLCNSSDAFKHQLADKAEELEALNQRISELVSIHDDWQAFDDELRLLESTLTQSMHDIEDLWPSLRNRAATLYAHNKEIWAQRLSHLTVLIEQALKKQSIVDTKKCFIRFRSAARDRFYVADQDLKTGCQLLQKAGEPINAFLRTG